MIQVSMHVFVHYPIVELFVNNEIVTTTRIYPTNEDSRSVAVFINNGKVRVNSLDIYAMEDVYG